MQPSIETFLEAAASAGWQVERREASEPLDLPGDVVQRYASVPESYRAFLCQVASATSADERAWFLCETQFRPSGPEGFAWNEIERMALESADDETKRQAIRSFWDRPEGAVVHGAAPEWEQVDRLADSFEDWLSMLTTALREPANPSSTLARRPFRSAHGLVSRPSTRSRRARPRASTPVFAVTYRAYRAPRPGIPPEVAASLQGVPPARKRGLRERSRVRHRRRPARVEDGGAAIVGRVHRFFAIGLPAAR